MIGFVSRRPPKPWRRGPADFADDADLFVGLSPADYADDADLFDDC